MYPVGRCSSSVMIVGNFTKLIHNADKAVFVLTTEQFYLAYSSILLPNSYSGQKHHNYFII